MAGEDLAALIEEQGARLEQQLNESINASERTTTAEGAELTYDLAIALLPQHVAGLGKDDSGEVPAPVSATSRRSRRQSQQRGYPDGTAATAAEEEEDAAEGAEAA